MGSITRHGSPPRTRTRRREWSGGVGGPRAWCAAEPLGDAAVGRRTPPCTAPPPHTHTRRRERSGGVGRPGAGGVSSQHRYIYKYIYIYTYMRLLLSDAVGGRARVQGARARQSTAPCPCTTAPPPFPTRRKVLSFQETPGASQPVPCPLIFFRSPPPTVNGNTAVKTRWPFPPSSAPRRAPADPPEEPQAPSHTHAAETCPRAG